MWLYLQIFLFLSMNYHLTVPKSNPPVGAISLTEVEMMAKKKVEGFWGEEASIDTVVPFSGYDGKDVAYLVILRQKGRYIGPNMTDNREYVVVSAKRSSVPIPEFGRGLPTFCTRGQLFLRVAERYLGGKAKLVRIYYGSPGEEYYEFRGQARDIIIDPFSFKVVKKRDFSFIGGKRSFGKAKGVIRKAWQDIENAERSNLRRGSEKKVEEVPFFIWSYGCTPTASAMVLGYWDIQGYDRLIEYYFDHWDVAIASYIDTGWIYNVPDVQKALAIAMETDTTYGGTFVEKVAPGQMEVAQERGYEFSSYDILGDETNDWAWSEIKAEIDAGRPFNWSISNYYYIGPHHGFIDTMVIYHSVTGVGYVEGDSLAEDYVIVHDTWSSFERYWSLFTYYDDGGYSSHDAVSFIPESAPLGNIWVEAPKGGSCFWGGDTAEVKWDFDVPSADFVNLYATLNNGESWMPIAESLPALKKDFLYALPDTYTENLRFRAILYGGGKEVASDANIDNLMIISGNGWEGGGIDTLNYENNSPFYVDPLIISGFDHPNVRFTAPDSLRLLGASFYLHAKHGSGWNLRVSVYSDSVGFPKKELGAQEVPYDALNTREEGTGWTYVDLSSLDLSFRKGEDFHIGISPEGVSMDSLSLIVDNGYTDRSSFFYKGKWQRLKDVVGIGKNFFIQAIIQHDGFNVRELSHINGHSIKLFPIPTDGKINIIFDSYPGKNFEFSLFDASGRLVTLRKGETKRKVNLYLGTLPKGVYLYSFRVGDLTYRGKILLMPQIH